MSQFVNGGYVSGHDQLDRILVDPKQSATFTIQPVGAKTVTGSGATIVANETENPVSQLGVVATVVVTAVSGTTPTLVVSLQDAATSGGSYTTEGSSISITAAGTYTFLVPISNLFYRASWVIGGTTPSFTFAVYATTFHYGSAV